ncbi:uncharacterized protein TNCV_3114321 [Trichonephila clavipes]|nr:uncharacterized protein TNCV_3114321 [Trichonephila clavipes]
MADELTCSSEAIQKYLVDNGGKISNQELVKHFKKFLTGPNSRPDARAIFKDYVNAVATIKVEDLSGHGHEFMASFIKPQVQVLMPLKISCIAGLMHVKSVVAQDSNICMVWKLGKWDASSSGILIT